MRLLGAHWAQCLFLFFKFFQIFHSNSSFLGLTTYDSPLSNPPLRLGLEAHPNHFQLTRTRSFDSMRGCRNGAWHKVHSSVVDCRSPLPKKRKQKHGHLKRVLLELSARRCEASVLFCCCLLFGSFWILKFLAPEPPEDPFSTHRRLLPPPRSERQICDRLTIKKTKVWFQIRFISRCHLRD